MKTFVIDIHAHYTPALLFERFASRAAAFPGVQLKDTDKGYALQFDGDKPRSVMPALTDLAARRTWMDANGIDHQLVGGWLESFGYELPPEQGLAWSRFHNECLRDALRDEPRFTPLATVPLQDGKLAAQVLTEAMAEGFGGVMIGTLPQGASGTLDAASLDPFWETASSLRAAVFVHPMTFCGEPRLDDYGLMNAVGRLEDTSIAVSRLIFSGHVRKYAGAKLVLSHGGGSLPYALGRLQRSYDNAKGKVDDPRAAFARVHFDSCVFDVAALEYLVRVAGDERVMLGSDAPFPMSDPEPMKVIAAANLTAEQRERIVSSNAMKVFRIRADCGCAP